MTDGAPAQRRSMRPLYQTMLVDVAPPLIAYYGLRALGFSEYVALLSATLVSGMRVIYGIVKSRKLDPFAGYLLLNFGLSLAVGLSTNDPKLILVGNTFVNGIGGLIFLGSCVIGTPLTQVVGERFGPPPEVLDDAAAARRRRIHVQLSAMWGIGLLLEVALRLVVISRMSVDAANGVTSAISMCVIGLLVVATIAVSRRAVAAAQAAG